MEENKELYEKRIKEPIIEDVSVKQKSKFSKVLEMFAPEDVEDMKKYIIKDRIIPSVKGLIWDVCNAVLASILGTDVPQSRPGYSNNRNKPSYASFYDNKSRVNNTPSVSVYDYEDLIMRTRVEADNVLYELRRIEHEYGNVRVADYYETVGFSPKHPDYNYGWSIDLGNDLRNATVYYVSGQNGYSIRLPRAMALKR